MLGVFATSPENTVGKHFFWLVRSVYYKVIQSPDERVSFITQAFNGCQAATLSPLFFLSPALLARAALYTCGVVGSLAYVGATAT
jgi:hypothetical protein